MRAWILYDSERIAVNQEFAEMLKNACEERRIQCSVMIDSEITISVQQNRMQLFYQGRPCVAPDFVIRRCVNDKLTLYLEAMNIRVFNNSQVSVICNDKFLTYQTACALGIDTVDSFLFSSSSDLNCIEFDAPYIVKSRFGHGGKDVMRFSSINEVRDICCPPEAGRLILQPYMECGTSDIRCYIMGNTLISAVKRTAVDGFKSNFCLGGKAESYNLSVSQEQIVRRIAATFPMSFIGIDFFLNNDKFILNEIEDVVGTRMLYSLFSFNAAEEYVEYILRNI